MMKLSLTRLRHIVASLSFIGAGFMVYLIKLHYAKSGGSVCDLSTMFSCSVVNKSEFSEIFGVPIAVLGLLYFLAITAMMLYKHWPQPFREVTLFTLFSLSFGIYLSGIEFIVLDSFCLFCELSKVVMLAILIFAVMGTREGKEKMPVAWIIGAVVVGLAFSIGTYMMQHTSAPEDVIDRAAVARCLDEKGVKMYGAYWCHNCANQKKWFGDAFELIEEIECDPRGENAQAALCVEKEIEGTPTWIWEQDGEEIKRLSGATKIDKLADYFECTK
ncbi:vitamin K epoxide reductase family protein [Patescibacteria group bacterium]